VYDRPTPAEIVYRDELLATRRALRALVLAPATRAWLEANDPKALAQADDALPMGDGL
jgi:hypothetical protein